MLRPHVIEEVRQLLADGQLSQREIARRVGLSRATIGAIADGTRAERAGQQPIEDLESPEVSQQPATRCGECGGLVYMPCRLCHIRRLKRRQQARGQWRRWTQAPRLSA